MSRALQNMLQLVHTHAAGERAAILDRARGEAARILATAHRESRARMHLAVADIRQVMQRELRQAQAALETARRQQRTRCDAALLEGAWRELPAALAQRWRDGNARRIWIERLLHAALATLPRGHWEIAHAADLSPGERDLMVAQLHEELGEAPTILPEAAIPAGMRIHAQGACLDGTIAGLLLDKRALEGRLLALFSEDAR
jgi:hypothetical protein